MSAPLGLVAFSPRAAPGPPCKRLPASSTPGGGSRAGEKQVPGLPAPESRRCSQSCCPSPSVCPSRLPARGARPALSDARASQHAGAQTASGLLAHAPRGADTGVSVSLVAASTGGSWNPSRWRRSAARRATTRSSIVCARRKRPPKAAQLAKPSSASAPFRRDVADRARAHKMQHHVSVAMMGVRWRQLDASIYRIALSCCNAPSGSQACPSRRAPHSRSTSVAFTAAATREVRAREHSSSRRRKRRALPHC